MKVVGLLSGGKDSCYNLCHCAAQGHDIVALASLRPEGGKEEIDSYLYQTVGQDGLHFIAEAFGLPLVRREIRGSAVDQASDYASTSAARSKGRVDGDETEDLYELLKEVLALYPNIEGVSVGAILSNYQRIRVEHVCARLGLQALSYLWQYDQSQLLEEMAEAGMECIIIKVAGAGLGLRHLGKDVCSVEMRQTLAQLKDRWGTHPAGEGGEYETFTVNCPLFQKRIDLTSTEQVVISSSDPRYDLGTVAYLRLKEALLVPQASKPSNSDIRRSVEQIPVPDLLDEDAQSLRRLLLGQADTNSVEEERGVTHYKVDSEQLPSTTGRTDMWHSVGNIASPLGNPQEQMQACFAILQEKSAEVELNLLHIAHINLYISSMSLFPELNAVYNTYFGPSPPTRACVACPLPEGHHVKMDVVAYKAQNTHERTALHVRSLSYWAPANIGPYSQAVRIGGRLFVAGQVGLIPPTLRLPDPSCFVTEVALAAQHYQRVVKAVQEGTGGGFEAEVESCICWVSGPANTFATKRSLVRQAWKRLQAQQRPKKTTQDAPFLIVQVPELPKGAQVEWQLTWRTDRGTSIPNGDEDEEDDTPNKTQLAHLSLSHKLHRQNEEVFSLRIFHVTGIRAAEGLHKFSITPRSASYTAVPVTSLATLEEDSLSAACLSLAAQGSCLELLTEL